MTDKKPTVAQLLRKVERLEAQLQSSRALVGRIATVDWDMTMENADMREQLRQIAEIAGGKQ